MALNLKFNLSTVKLCNISLYNFQEDSMTLIQTGIKEQIVLSVGFTSEQRTTLEVRQNYIQNYIILYLKVQLCMFHLLFFR